MSAKTFKQVTILHSSLQQYAAQDRVEWTVGKMANALIDEAKREVPDSPVLSAIEPLQPGPNDVYVRNMSASGLAAILAQVANTLPESDPPRPRSGGAGITGGIADQQF